MKKLVTLVCMLVVATSLFAQTSVLWEKSVAKGNFPTFLGTGSTERGFATGTVTVNPFVTIFEKSAAAGNFPSYLGTGSTQRGFAFGKFGTEENILVVERKLGNQIYILNPATGDSLGRLDTTGLAAIASGAIGVNDIEISTDSVIFVGNVTTNASTSAFKIYKWANKAATPVLAVNYTGLALRFGDKFTVTGSTADNSIVIWAVSATNNKLVKFTTTDNGVTFTPTEITLTGVNQGNSPAVIPNNDASELYVKSNGQPLKRYLANGTLVDSIPTSIVGTGSNALRYFEANGKKYLVIYNYGTGNENLRVVDVTAGLATATVVGLSNTLGAVSNGNGVGDVALRLNGDNTVNAYVLATNNGIAGYKLNPKFYGINERMYVVSRNGGTKIIALNAATGDSVRTLDVTGISGGTFTVNDADVSSDGVLFVCNLTTNATTSSFKVYRWKNESAAPESVISYAGLALRFGDKFTVTGSTADNSVTIWAAAALSNKLVKFTTTDKGATFTPTEITLSGVNMGNSPAVHTNNDGSELYINSNGQYLKRYLANGTLVDSIPGTIVGTGSNALRYFELAPKKYLAVYNYGANNENVRILDITNGLLNAALVTKTDSLGTIANGNGTGDISAKSNGDGSENIYILSTNNGLAAYRFSPPTKLAKPTFVPAGGIYYDSIYIKILASQTGAKIYYTLNGTDPDSVSGILFVDSIKIKDTTKVKAIVYASGFIASDIDSAQYDMLKTIVVVVPPSTPLYQAWGKTQAGGTFPAYFSTGNYERGMSYGKVKGKDRVYVVARTGGPRVIVFDAITGDSVGIMMPTASVNGGTFPLNFVDVSDDGVVLVGNMTIDASSSAFKVYRWDSEQDTPKVVINYTDVSLSGGRLGDIISVSGKASDNTLQIYAAVSASNKFVKFSTADNGNTFTSQIISLSNSNVGSLPNVAVASDTSFYFKSYGKPVYRYKSNGALIDSISTSIVGTDATNIRYFEKGGKKYLLVFYPNDGAPYTDERLAVVNVTDMKAPYAEFTSASIGDKPNLNGTGAVDYMELSNGELLYFIMGTNNGVAAFTSSASVVISKLDTLFYGTSQNVLKNPYKEGGYIVGTNGYGDIGKYQRFDFKKGDKLSAYKLWFGFKQIVDAPDTIWTVVKTVAVSGKPDSTIASIAITTDKIDTTKKGNYFVLPYPITLNGPIFIGFEFTGNDTIALISDKDGEGDKANRVWEKFNDGTYNDFTNPTLSWGLDIDLWIAAYYKKNTTTVVEQLFGQVPTQFSLEQNYPNPFNPTTTIRFSVPMSARVSLKIFNILGQQVAELINSDISAGTHNVTFNASSLSTGVYFYRLEASAKNGSTFSSVKKLMLVK